MINRKTANFLRNVKLDISRMLTKEDRLAHLSSWEEVQGWLSASPDFFWVQKIEIDNILLFSLPDLKSVEHVFLLVVFRKFPPLIARSKLSTN